MTRTKPLFAFLSIALVVAAVSSQHLPAQAPDAFETPAPKMERMAAGQYLVLCNINGVDDTKVLVDPQPVNLGNRSFLKGRTSKDQNYVRESLPNRICYIPVDNIRYIQALDE